MDTLLIASSLVQLLKLTADTIVDVQEGNLTPEALEARFQQIKERVEMADDIWVRAVHPDQQDKPQP